MSKQKAIFFDRDGTLIYDEHYLNDYKEIRYLPEVFKTLTELKNAGYVFVVVTNQSGIARGLVTEEQMHKIHEVMIKDFKKHSIEFLDFYFSPHLPDSNHPTRKPNPGMLLAAAEKHNIDLSKSWMIGDKMSDVDAGLNAGCRAILLSTDKDKKVEHQAECIKNVNSIILAD